MNDLGKPDLASFILDVPDYPKPGINFKDITPLLADGLALSLAIDELADFFRKRNAQLVAGIEARGFILGAAVARQLGIGFIPLRKPGKSPRPVHSVKYQLEYGVDELQVHRGLINPGMRVAVIDDVLATGGTCVAAMDLIEAAEGEVAGFGCLLELSFLSGRSRIAELHSEVEILSLVTQ